MDRPNLAEILEAVAEFLEREALPHLAEPRTRFLALVALNALGVARREVLEGEALVREDLEALKKLLGREGAREELLAELSQRIRQGTPPPGTFPFLKAHVRRKLLIANPKYLERYP
ncbi:DUF6285 domain-containing protein [Thermus igniterrae]|jgi:nucleotide-binding universal stress UspA family protein|uniref:DUF6285 domain-containing protein n=1 Tax=Thermus igniterrae TaxID=88189 RepID=UPI000476E7C3|nr:DUF6285 domain-containing protein [Thermus igniterrae]